MTNILYFNFKKININVRKLIHFLSDQFHVTIRKEGWVGRSNNCVIETIFNLSYDLDSSELDPKN